MRGLVILLLAPSMVWAKSAALFVGVDQYDQPGLTLRGATNDVRALSAVFLARDPTCSARVLSGRVTGSEVKSALERMIKIMGRGDTFLFVFCGHGHEVVVPKQPVRQAMIFSDLSYLMDFTIRDLSASLTSRGVHARFIFDCCFAGGMMREVPKVISFEGEPATFENRYIPSTRFRRGAPVELKIDATRGVSQNGDLVFLMASGASQPTIEVQKSVSRGLFSIALENALKLHPDASVAAIMKDVQARFATWKLKGRQDPWFSASHGAENARFF